MIGKSQIRRYREAATPAVLAAGLLATVAAPPAGALPAGVGAAAEAGTARPARGAQAAPSEGHAGPGRPSAAADTTAVQMTNSLKFAPAEVTVKAGATVTWKNGSVLVHTVTAAPDSAAKPGSVKLPEGAEPFGSGRLEPGDSFSYTFETPGTYRYFCIPHEAAGMVATVRVIGG